MEKFKWALQCDMVVSSGGVSVGDYDLVKATLKKNGAGDAVLEGGDEARQAFGLWQD